MEVVQQDLDTLEREGVAAVDRADWLRAMQGRRASLADVLDAAREGLMPWDWEGSP
jgi:hypothetical protein